MLKDSPLDTVLLQTDLEAAKEFYAHKLGLSIIDESEQSISFNCGTSNRLTLSKSTIGTKDTQTQASWRVDDLKAVLTDLRSRGVKIEEYDSPELKTEGGIADVGFALSAWIVDPGNNVLGILQYK